MSWLELTALLGNLGEFVGAIAVVATLIYLAVQVRSAKASLDANTAALEEDRRLALVQTYQTGEGHDLLHYDLYRLEEPEELIELGWDEVGSDRTIALIEWPNRIGEMPVGNVLHLQIDTGENNLERQLYLHGYGDWGNRMDDLLQKLSS